MIKGMVIGGSFNNVIIREKTGAGLEIGELLIGDIDHGKVLLQVYDLNYSSQISQQNLELISGMGVGYYFIYKNLYRNIDLVKLGIVYKVVYSGLTSYFYFANLAHVLFLWFAIFDIIFLILFVWFLIYAKGNKKY